MQVFAEFWVASSVISGYDSVCKGHVERERERVQVGCVCVCVVKVCVNLAILKYRGALQVCWLSCCRSCPDFIKSKCLTKRFVVLPQKWSYLHLLTKCCLFVKFAYTRVSGLK